MREFTGPYRRQGSDPHFTSPSRIYLDGRFPEHEREQTADAIHQALGGRRTTTTYFSPGALSASQLIEDVLG